MSPSLSGPSCPDEKIGQISDLKFICFPNLRFQTFSTTFFSKEYSEIRLDTESESDLIGILQLKVGRVRVDGVVVLVGVRVHVKTLVKGGGSNTNELLTTSPPCVCD